VEADKHDYLYKSCSDSSDPKCVGPGRAWLGSALLAGGAYPKILYIWRLVLKVVAANLIEAEIDLVLLMMVFMRTMSYGIYGTMLLTTSKVSFSLFWLLRFHPIRSQKIETLSLIEDLRRV
jgi:hypothetical protein